MCMKESYLFNEMVYANHSQSTRKILSSLGMEITTVEVPKTVPAVNCNCCQLHALIRYIGTISTQIKCCIRGIFCINYIWYVKF